MYNKSEIFTMIQSLCTSIWINCTVFMVYRVVSWYLPVATQCRHCNCNYIQYLLNLKHCLSLQDDEEYSGFCFQIFLIINCFNKTSFILFLNSDGPLLNYQWHSFLATKCISCLETDVKTYWRIFFSILLHPHHHN